MADNYICLTRKLIHVCVHCINVCLNRFADAMFPRRLCGWFGEGLNPSHPISLSKLLLIYKLYRISVDKLQRQELRRADKL